MTSPPRQQSIPDGAIIGGKYLVMRSLGAGGMGEVLLAKHMELDKRVAIKLLKPELAWEKDWVARFMREARAACRIRDEHVVRVFDVARLDDGTPYMVMEYLEGEDLARVLERGPLPPHAAVEYVLEACVAIAEAHRVGIVHRDLKPANIFLAHRGGEKKPIVKVVDFGISKVASTAERAEAATTSRSLMGSPFYMAPEALRGDDVDPRADIWAIGVILFELLTGEGPFEAPTMPQLCVQVMSLPARRLAEVRPDLPRALDEIIERCLAKDPDERFQDVGSLMTELMPFAPESAKSLLMRSIPPPSSGPWAPPPPSTPTVAPLVKESGRRAARRRKRNVAVLVAASALAVGVCALGLMRVITAPAPAATTFARAAPPAVTTAEVPAPIEPLPPEAPPPATSAALSAPSGARTKRAAPPSASPSPPPLPPARPAAGGGDEFGGRK